MNFPQASQNNPFLQAFMGTVPTRHTYVNFIPFEALVQYADKFADERTTRMLEQTFDQYILDCEVTTHTPSGDIDGESIVDAFHEYMSEV